MPSYSKYTYRHTTGALLVFVRTWRTGSCCTIRDVERQHFNALCFGFASASVGGDCVRIYMQVLTVGLGKLLSVYLLPSARAIFQVPLRPTSVRTAVSPCSGHDISTGYSAMTSIGRTRRSMFD